MIKIPQQNNVISRNPPIRCMDLFSVPLYEKYFAGHHEFKQTVIDQLLDDDLYIRNTQRSTLKFTHPNLHKEPAFKPFVDFVKEAVTEVFNDLGYIPNFELMGLWATRHIEKGYHHRHLHHNSFLGGVYYFNGVSGKTAGTTFFSDWKSFVIRPAAISPERIKIKQNFTTVFEEGKLVLFPAFLEHDTLYNPEDSDRIILSFNCMPVGKTNTDPFERYNYQSTENAELISYNDEKYK